MRRKNVYDHQPWFLTRVSPEVVAGSRRWNLVLIFILTFFVIAVFVMSLTPEPGHATSHALSVPVQTDSNPHP